FSGIGEIPQSAQWQPQGLSPVPTKGKEGAWSAERVSGAALGWVLWLALLQVWGHGSHSAAEEAAMIRTSCAWKRAYKSASPLKKSLQRGPTWSSFPAG